MERLKTNNSARQGAGSAGADQGLLVLPRSFWGVADSVRQSWKDMRSILVEEWRVLRSGDFMPLVEIAEKKRRQAEKISEAERTIAAMADRILEMCGIDGGIDGVDKKEGRWNMLMRLVNNTDVSSLDSWLTEIRLLRQEVILMNQRHDQWIRGQIRMVRDMLGVITGGERSREMSTYGPTARMRSNYAGIRGRYKVEVT
ncbi:MAG: hypothetical protein ACUVQ6_04380 [Dissulfurimicrobium sp.]|uniref:hypothetical protein n=1 Tax=Dissulfurimicrobium sp. TaxID=2022436 RepID=UPI00404A2A3D